MNILAIESGAAKVATALCQCGCEINPRRNRSWLVTPRAKAGPQRLLAREEDGWLSLSVPVPAEGRNTWEMLLQRTLPPLMKLTLAPDGGIIARADLAIGEPGLLAKRVAQIIGALSEDWLSLGGQTQQNSSPKLPAPAPATTQVLIGWLKDSGWRCTPRGDQQLRVGLELPGEAREAIVAPLGPVVSVSIVIGTWPQLDPAPREAISVFLLALAHSLRLAGVFADSGNGQLEAGFEVRLPAEPTAGELDDALGALSLACRLGAEELLALQDVGLAQAYLQLRENTTNPTTQTERNKT
jgi:hypothetical protein